MTKSSVKTFENGKNEFNGERLKGAKTLGESIKGGNVFDSFYKQNGHYFYIDVLADGTAVNYCPDVEFTAQKKGNKT
ncbi:hypothetical protein UFOVP276_233 [uncultured Caudovirales phage]|uniref:Uncharacterized protein n=1 Tax=uncultured Caudovirales phage TaxID=2100421 RepID=A0A6J5LEG0_9CAUD|nr:hypothetical protein UFOVP127_127 [uncultured Caudovirales phage]CAB4135277.1 hypothetical protein UFOVP276_233 [uncultured Caudovirales phage]